MIDLRKGGQHGALVAPVHPNAGNARPERVTGVATGGDGYLMPRAQQALNQQFAKIAGTADNQYILAHGFSLFIEVYFLLRSMIEQQRKIEAMTKKNLLMAVM